jgi:hypothetical protein
MIAFLAACAAQPAVPAARFANASPVVAVDDRRDVARAPEQRPYNMHLYFYDGSVSRPLARALELRPARRALGTNALDEVPDSTWFTNRIAARARSLDELRRGPTTIDSPELHKPWTITSTKAGGAEVGFVMRDARDIKFVLKFDDKGFPEQETAAHVIVSRLLWAVGYHVPEDFLVNFRDEDLVLAPDAKVQGRTPRRLDRGELARRLAAIERGGDGRIRAIASRWLPGTPLGGPPAEGVRAGDPNDRIPHELRRDLRGLYTVAAWLDHVDIKEDNFLDMWTPDARDPARRYVEHYLIDFGKSLGVMAATSNDLRLGYDYLFDGPQIVHNLFALGLETRPWERRAAPAIRGVGAFDAASFDPDGWKGITPAFAPFLAADRFDKFWAAKIVMRFSREQLRAIVESAGYSDPRAVDYVTDTLAARQRAIGAYWFARVNPLDRFAIDGDALCFDDLALVHQLAPAAATTYATTIYDRAGRALAGSAAIAPVAARTCAPLQLAGGDGYTIVRVTTTRAHFVGTTYVHVARDHATSRPRVIGVWRA